MEAPMSAPLCAGMLFVGMLVCLDVGRRLGIRRLALDPDGAKSGSSAMETSVFALFGLLISFTFAGAASRFDTRRALIVEEANDIGTAWLRLDLLPNEAQPALRNLFREYLDSRLETYRKLPDIPAVTKELAHTATLQAEIWKQAVAACSAKQNPAVTTLVTTSLNAMIDITTTRTMAGQMHPPRIIFVLLFTLALACSCLAGYGVAGATARSWPHMLGFAVAIAFSIFVIVDLEYPRFGLIRVDATDQVLVALRESMK